MTAIPATFRAFVATQEAASAGDGGALGAGDAANLVVTRGVRTFAEVDLPAGEVEVRVGWSSVNYKDGLATIPNGKVARINPLIPGIDLAGEVIASDDPTMPVGAHVLAHGHDLGVARHGGYAEYQRVPAGWVVPLPGGLTPRLAMAVGTAGFTAALSVVRMEERGLRPSNGPVLVTGASGGVGSNAVGILAGRGYEVWAATGKADEAERLRGIGAAGILARDDVTAGSARPLESERWAGAVDCVGGSTLPYILRTLRRGGTVAASGNTGGPAFATTVFPFILRSVALVGIDSAVVPIAERRAVWERIATDLRPRGLGDALTEVSLDSLPGALDAILAGRARGRWIVRIGG
jgi:putative YhdH/YhfP family quinone oxidoreductase